MLRIIALVAVLLVVAVLGYAATRPDTFRVQRTATIAAPPEAIFPHIADFHAWAAWSPYEKLDPAMKKTFGGAESGRGAVYAWEGNAKAGAGRMEITEAAAPSRVTVSLEFVKPFRIRNTAEFTLQPRGGATHVTWAMHGPSPFVSKLMGVFIDIDRMVGRDFEAGLASLKILAESGAPDAALTLR